MSDEFDPVRFVEGHEWTFASTMKNIPHEYVVRGKGCAPDDWDAMWAYMRKHGFWARWFGRINIYLEIDVAVGGKRSLGHRYWMIYPVINREVIDPKKSNTVPLEPEEAETASRLTEEVPVTLWAWGETGLFRYPVPQGEQPRLFKEEDR